MRVIQLIVSVMLFAVALAYFMSFEIPRFESLFAGLDIRLSSGFLVVRDVAAWLRDNGLFFVYLACAGLCLDSACFLALRRRVSRRSSRVYGWIVTVSLVACIGLVMLSVAEMLARIINS